MMCLLWKSQAYNKFGLTSIHKIAFLKSDMTNISIDNTTSPRCMLKPLITIADLFPKGYKNDFVWGP